MGVNDSRIPSKEECIPDNKTPMRITNKHYVTKNPIQGPFPPNIKTAVFGTGCFWGAEKGFWRMPGVYSTAVGYAAGHTAHATYDNVCTGRTGHNEVVHVAYDPSKIAYPDLLRMFWAQHDPTQGMGQGNDRGTQYRSGIYYYDDDQKTLALASKDSFQEKLKAKVKAVITTEIIPAPEFYYAEDYHQQYLAKPGARPYCSAQPTGIALGFDWIPKAFLPKHSPKLPETFWEKEGPKPGCTIVHGPNEQFVL
uniref:peptide-methionine (S)-S-oxide reductase n=1 Tax=Pyramimonas obovata TaxID=1411642 RepID=A0A7S0WQU7_9CHLO|mmetsp:Transcript_35428/g.77370  ORF Transcript_35428/g.77370 Transcript_35428/m.77370 type:complete len:252 (+) Transcript_35428:82-837(+)